MRARVIPGGIALVLSSAFAGCGLSVMGVPPDDAGMDAGPDGALVADADPLAETSTPPDVEAGGADGDATIDSGTPPCDGGPLECCGGKACPSGTTECIDDRCYVTVTVAARIDGRDDLLLKAATARWQHHQYEPPSALKLNDATWTAQFPGNNGPNETCTSCFSSTSKPLAPQVAAHPQAGILSAKTGRGTVTLAAATEANGYTLAVQFSDPESNPGNYTATIKYETR